MAGVDSAGLGEVIQSLIPSFIESRSRQGTLDFVDDRREVIQVRLFDLIWRFNLKLAIYSRTYFSQDNLLLFPAYLNACIPPYSPSFHLGPKSASSVPQIQQWMLGTV